MDLSKASTLAPAEVATLWTTYHQSKGFLSAAIPTDVYNRMLANGKKYPMFVLPLARDDPDAPEGEQGAVEMHLLVSSHATRCHRLPAGTHTSPLRRASAPWCHVRFC